MVGFKNVLINIIAIILFFSISSNATGKQILIDGFLWSNIYLTDTCLESVTDTRYFQFENNSSLAYGLINKDKYDTEKSLFLNTSIIDGVPFPGTEVANNLCTDYSFLLKTGCFNSSIGQ